MWSLEVLHWRRSKVLEHRSSNERMALISIDCVKRRTMDDENDREREVFELMGYDKERDSNEVTHTKVTNV